MTDTPDNEVIPPAWWKPSPTDDRGYRPGKKKKAVTPAKMNRKACEFTPEKGAEIVRILRAGNCRDTAAASAGVLSDTFRKWLLRGVRGEEPFATWAAEVKQAEAEAEQEMLNCVRQSGFKQKFTTTTKLEKNGHVETTVEEREEPGDARGPMWILERRGAKNWSLGVIERRSKEQAEARRAAKGEGKQEGLQVTVSLAQPKT